jgi:hypothetical protein
VEICTSREDEPAVTRKKGGLNNCSEQECCASGFRLGRPRAVAHIWGKGARILTEINRLSHITSQSNGEMTGEFQGSKPPPRNQPGLGRQFCFLCLFQPHKIRRLRLNLDARINGLAQHGLFGAGLANLQFAKATVQIELVLGQEG